MRYWIAVVFSLLVASVNADELKVAENNWLPINYTDGDKRILGAVWGGLPDVEIRQQSAVLLLIDWSYPSTANGLPSSEDFEQIKRFSKALEDVLGTNDRWYLSLKMLGKNKVSFGAYVDDYNAFRRQYIRKVSSSLPQYPVNIVQRKDPQWMMLQQLQGL